MRAVAAGKEGNERERDERVRVRVRVSTRFGSGYGCRGPQSIIDLLREAHHVRVGVGVSVRVKVRVR